MYLAPWKPAPYPERVTSSPTTAPSGASHAWRLLREQPRGLYLVAITEFWERFSYWGMLGLLVLFLTAPTATGGFGWSSEDALALYALYTGAVFSAPAVGGYLASRYFGERRCILWGGVCVAAGHFLLAGPALYPWLAGQLAGQPIGEWLHGCGITLGKIWPDAAISSALPVLVPSSITEKRYCIASSCRPSASRSGCLSPLLRTPRPRSDIRPHGF